MSRKVPEQIVRLGIVAAIIFGGTGLIVYRLPPALKSQRFHRQTTLQAESERSVQFAGFNACGDCHDDEYQKKKTGYHKNLSCETCHGPAAGHVADPVTVKPFVSRERRGCPVCHEYDASRPTGFPQIVPTVHNPLQPCVTCHNPHDPVPPKTPEECSACHAGIVRTKAVSSHALVACTQCHTVPEQHKATPRIVRPTKPETRDFCGKCHARGSPVVAPPKIDISTHGEKYVCWQCHYPHLPAERL
ncbi:MAG: hypothetical protein HY315_02365 [Acidobacteria bacterium]|nr:hypothetical protein [Acidobacteriota bacterium]